MNNSTQAQKGLKTFIATLIVSFVVFSAVYYLATQYSTNTSLAVDKPADVMGAQTVAQEVQQQPAQDQDATSPFGDLAKSTPTVSDQPGAVLAGTDTQGTTPQTTTPVVPDTGTTEITFGVVLSVLVFIIGVYYLKTDPRGQALREFEKKF